MTPTSEYVTLMIEEEYGFRDWIAWLTAAEYEDLVRRWQTLKGLTCLVPVCLIVPQAIEIKHHYSGDDDLDGWDEVDGHQCTWGQLITSPNRKCCHIHECDDSYLDGADCEIPEHPKFCMDGREYEEHEYWPDMER